MKLPVGPFTIEPATEGHWTGFAWVVRDGLGSVMGFHASRADAEFQRGVLETAYPTPWTRANTRTHRVPNQLGPDPASNKPE